MWCVDPKLLCRKHLLGEHLELHMLAGAIKKGRNLKGYIDKGLVELDHIGNRHKEITKEMKRRDYRHNSPLRQPSVSRYKDLGKVNKKKSYMDLITRCNTCEAIILGSIIINSVFGSMFKKKRRSKC